MSTYRYHIALKMPVWRGQEIGGWPNMTAEHELFTAAENHILKNSEGHLIFQLTDVLIIYLTLVTYLSPCTIHKLQSHSQCF